jgi:predicted O-linked N-acetylglucosamine transferase (SPINDLY family)
MKLDRNAHCSCGSGKKYKHCCERNAAARSTLPTTETNRLQALFNAGRFAEVEPLAIALLEQCPDEPTIWKLLAMALQMQGKAALSAFQKTAELLPDDAGAQMNLGNALQDAGHLNEAVESYQRTIVIKPNFAEAYNNLGSVYISLGQFEHAATNYRHAIQLKPNFATAHSCLGNALRDLGQLGEAVESYRRAIKVQPNLTEAHNNLGVALRELGFFDQAVSSYRQALKIEPNYAEVHSNLGVALRDLGQLDNAATSFRRALEIDPNDAETCSNLGLALHDLGRFDEAVKHYRRALAIKPNYAEAHNNLGLTLHARGKYDESVESCRQAIALMPSFTEAYNNLGSTLQSIGQLEEAIVNYRRALQINPDFVIAQSNLLFSLGYTAQSTPADYLAEALRFEEMVNKSIVAQFSTWQCESQPNKLKVGILSGDLWNHPVGYFTESLLGQLDLDSIELIAYTNNPKADDLTARIRPYFAHWRPVFNLNDAAVAQLIHEDGVHILLDLSGHTAKNRLSMFAWKPAPIQATWLGYFATTGVAEIDYLLADAYMVPSTDEHHFTESIWRLPDSYLCFTPPNVDIKIEHLPAVSTRQITFGCFNNLTKMNDAVIALWARVLLAVPGSRLFLKTLQLNDAGVCDTTRQKFAAQGVTADRLLLEGSSPRTELLAAYQRVDIALDPFPYPGGTTSVEALWMGVPVLTKRGDRFLSHMGESIMHNAGLSDWIADDDDDYVAKAIARTSNLERLAALHAGLRQQVLASPLFDAKQFARNFEAALWGMWQNRQMQQGIKK